MSSQKNYKLQKLWKLKWVSDNVIRWTKCTRRSNRSTVKSYFTSLRPNPALNWPVAPSNDKCQNDILMELLTPRTGVMIKWRLEGAYAIWVPNACMPGRNACMPDGPNWMNNGYSWTRNVTVLQLLFECHVQVRSLALSLKSFFCNNLKFVAAHTDFCGKPTLGWTSFSICEAKTWKSFFS